MCYVLFHNRALHLLSYTISYLPCSARVDCLTKRELTANEMTEHFKDRPDYLYYRHTTYGKVLKQRTLEATLVNKDSNLKPIIKIVERFHHNPSIPANSDVAERVFLLDENRIQVAYHLEKDRITPSTREFVTPTVSGDQGYTLHFDPEMTTAFQVNESYHHHHSHTCTLLMQLVVWGLYQIEHHQIYVVHGSKL